MMIPGPYWSPSPMLNIPIVKKSRITGVGRMKLRGTDKMETNHKRKKKAARRAAKRSRRKNRR